MIPDIKKFTSFTLEIAIGENGVRQLKRKMQAGRAVNFSSPVTDKRRPKLYLVKYRQEIIYVGFTTDPMANRIRYGLKGVGGYHGYKWKKLDRVELLIWVFDETFSVDRKVSHCRRLFYEAVEAELVFMYRQQEGDWPKHQNEIHFNNTSRTEVQTLAKKIYQELRA